MPTVCQIGIGPFACPSFGPDSNLTVLWRSVVEDTYFIRTPFLWPALATEHRSGGNSFFYFFLFLFRVFIPIAPTLVFVHVRGKRTGNPPSYSRTGKYKNKTVKKSGKLTANLLDFVRISG